MPLDVLIGKMSIALLQILCGAEVDNKVIPVIPISPYEIHMHEAENENFIEIFQPKV